MIQIYHWDAAKTENGSFIIQLIKYKICERHILLITSSLGGQNPRQNTETLGYSNRKNKIVCDMAYTIIVMQQNL